MNIIARGQAFVEWIKALGHRTAWDWRRCPHCGQRDTHKNGGYARHPWGLEGRKAQAHLAGQLEGVPSTGQMGADGLWARLRGQGKKVLLGLADSVSGVIWGVVVAAEESAACWGALFERAREVGLAPETLMG